MGRKLTDKELADPDIQALLDAVEKASKPVGRKQPKPDHAASERPIHDKPAGSTIPKL